MATTLRHIYNLIRLVKIPHDNDDADIYGEPPYHDIAEVIQSLLRHLQQNPLITPENITDVIREFGIEPDYTMIAHNPSWELNEALSNIHDEQDRFITILGITHRRSDFADILENTTGTSCLSDLDDDHYIYITQGEHHYIRRYTVEDCIHILSYNSLCDDIVPFTVYDDACFEVFNQFIRNPHISIDELVQIADYFDIHLMDSPFFINKGSFVKPLYNLFDRPDIDQSLGYIRDSMITTLIDPACIRIMFTCLAGMVATNPAWTPQVEEKYGKIVWKFIKFGWDHEWINAIPYVRHQSNQEMFHYFKEYLKLTNPSWLVPDSIRTDYKYPTSAQKPILLSTILRNSIDIIPFDLPDGFSPSYEKFVLNKDLLQTRDVIDVLQNSPTIDHLKGFVQKGTLRGDAAITIGVYCFRRVIVPNRRKRAFRLTKLILSRAKGGRVCCHDRGIRLITRFITA